MGTDEPTTPASDEPAVEQFILPPLMVRGFVGALEVGPLVHPDLGALLGSEFQVAGGTVELFWPLAFTPKIIEVMQTAYDEAVAAGAGSDLTVAKKRLWTPPA